MKEACRKVVTQPVVESMIETQLQPVSVEMPPQNAVETETAYAHGFQDGKAAEKAVHETVIKAILDSHKIDIEAAFKRGKEHSIMTAASQTLPTFDNASGKIAVGLTAGAICSRCGSPAIATSFGKHSKGFSASSWAITVKHKHLLRVWQLWQAWWHKRMQRRDIYSKYLQPGGSSLTPSINRATVNTAPKTGSDTTRTTTRLRDWLMPQASSEATPADLEHHMCEPMLSTKLGPAVNPATSSCIECTSTAAPTGEAEDDVAVTSKVIRDVSVYNKGSVDTERICRCPSTGRLQVLNRLMEEWSPLTDSDRLVADVSKLLYILQHLTHVDKCAGEPSPFCSLEQMHSLQKCARAVDIHDSNFDPCKAKVLTMQLAECLPNLPSRQPKVQIDSKRLSKTSTSCRAKSRKNCSLLTQQVQNLKFEYGWQDWLLGIGRSQMSHDIVPDSGHWYTRFHMSGCGYRCDVDNLSIET